MFGDIREGIRYIYNHHLVRLLLGLALASALLAMSFRFLVPIFIIDVYHRGPEAMGLLLSIMGGGAILGSLDIAALGRRRRGLVLIFGGIFSGLSLFGVVGLPYYFAAACIMVVLGVGDAIRRSLNMAMILEVVQDEYRGRASSVYTMNFGLMPLAVLPASIITNYFRVQVAAGIMAVLLLIICIGVLIPKKTCEP